MVTKGPPLVTIGTMRIHDLEQLENATNTTLKTAMSNERSKRWNKVVHTYRLLTRMLNKNNFPADVSIPPCYSMLMYETYYHLGTALQHLGSNKEAVIQYTKAIESVFVPKNGCLAGCNSNSCLMTPLYARRAFAFAKTGDLKNALKDAEKAVVLDSKNPDVFCIRALVRSTRNELTLALQDARRALKYNPNHLCALIIKGCLDEPQEPDEWLEPGKTVENIEHKKACSVNPDCHNFLDVQDFNHVNIVAFYERFLYSLSIPHTVSEIVFIPRKSSSTFYSTSESSAKSTDLKISTTLNRVQNQCTQLGMASHSQSTVQSFEQQSIIKPFRCGTPSGMSKERDVKAAQRRKHYAESIREHVTRPKTADDVIAHRERQRLKMELAAFRASKRAQKMTLADTKITSRDRGHVGMAAAATKRNLELSDITGRRMTVFQETNIKDAPRMYYRPWLGDKLPVADMDRKQWHHPPFRV